MFIVCVAACPTGVAHTYMAAESLDIIGKKRGHEVKVETQGSMGVENEITDEDLARADAVVLAADVAIINRERFDGMIKLECSVADPIKHGDAIFDAIEQEINNGEI
ncbi:PTS fructose transporter subunit IIB [Providencia burhodogranariea]|uniref:protein-N(pi)-phosphohistidine--D-fructose phosphotransferase n=1 Tax=Providencia burhodogranariea DSM 19968 TaxID=1141662 RepID=K8WNT5_9GAMM|nr:PTS fructose transporter subunit IIB [Providencia burhodogranariea]EKT62268.1 PTS system fructose-specific transporter subunit IIB [Providencia burhodogranariea DSM 19968]